MSLNSVLEKLENATELRNENWCLSPSACQLLLILAKSIGAKTICEVGTSIGFSTLHLAQVAEHTGGKVRTIEYYDSRQSQAKQSISDAGLGEFVDFHQGRALNILNEFVADNIAFDFVFVDATKKEYLDYFNLLSPNMPSGSLFIADNTQSHREQMKAFVDTILVDPRFEVSDLDTPMGMIIARKK
jgi:predicted O-methyltransferase YrrM